MGDGAGEEIVALVYAGFRKFWLRLFADMDNVEGGVPPSPALADPTSPAAYQHATVNLQPVQESAVLGRLVIAKGVLEFIASLIGVIGGLSALAAWLL